MKIKVRTRISRKGTISYALDYWVNGVRKQPSFKTQRLAEEERARLLKQQRRHGEGAVDLSQEEMAEFLALRRRVLDAGGSMHEAVEFFIQHGRLIREPLAFEALAAAYLRSREELNRGDRTIESIRSALGSLRRALRPQQAAHEVTRQDIQRWLRGQRWEPKTQRNCLGHASACFRWGMRELACVRQNPCEGVEIEKQPDKEIVTLSVADVRAMLEAARGDREMMTYVVLGIYCGLRPREMERLDRARINLHEKTVIVIGRSAKTRSRRVVDIPENAVQWLRSIHVHACGRGGALPAGKLCGVNWHERWRVFRRGCGWAVGGADAKGHRGALRAVAERVPVTRGAWTEDVMRHTFASYHYAMHQDESKLKAQMGHWEKSEALMQHYRALRTRVEAERFYSLVPTTKQPRLKLLEEVA